jgi:hypothetical protein
MNLCSCHRITHAPRHMSRQPTPTFQVHGVDSFENPDHCGLGIIVIIHSLAVILLRQADPIGYQRLYEPPLGVLVAAFRSDQQLPFFVRFQRRQGMFQELRYAHRVVPARLRLVLCPTRIARFRRDKFRVQLQSSFQGRNCLAERV